MATAGGLVGRQEVGTISTCYVKGATIEGGNNAAVGGLVGVQRGGTIRACYVSNITATAGNSGGGAGSLVGDQRSTNSLPATQEEQEKFILTSKEREAGGPTNSYYQAEYYWKW